MAAVRGAERRPFSLSNAQSVPSVLDSPTPEWQAAGPEGFKIHAVAQAGPPQGTGSAQSVTRSDSFVFSAAAAAAAPLSGGRTW
jgi:hypothetical protein